MYELILASTSPRRRHLLKEAGYQFSVHTVKVSENIEENLNPRAAVESLSRRKASHFLAQNKHLKLLGKLILTADTMVCLDSQLLGKPKNESEARLFLRSLSGVSHSVITAVSLVPDGLAERLQTFAVETKVELYPLSEE